jgi:hypothetical protein
MLEKLNSFAREENLGVAPVLDELQPNKYRLCKAHSLYT